MAASQEQSRFNMVEQQIRTWDVLDQSVLDLLWEVRRENFVPSAYRGLAFADLEIPLGPQPGQKMWQPKLEARVLQELKLRASDRVLEVGTGSGYLASLMARLSAGVISLEIDFDLHARAKEVLARQGVAKVELLCGDAALGWPQCAPYDVIVVSGSMPILPEILLRQLGPGGRCFAVVGDPPVMSARLVTQMGPEAWQAIDLFETFLEPLVNAEQPPRFVF